MYISLYPTKIIINKVTNSNKIILWYGVFGENKYFDRNPRI